MCPAGTVANKCISYYAKLYLISSQVSNLMKKERNLPYCLNLTAKRLYIRVSS
jgi:hypothetical protein